MNKCPLFAFFHEMTHACTYPSLVVADQGHAIAQNNLDRMFERGCGVKQDYSEAKRLSELTLKNTTMISPHGSRLLSLFLLISIRYQLLLCLWGSDTRRENEDHWTTRTSHVHRNVCHLKSNGMHHDPHNLVKYKRNQFFRNSTSTSDREHPIPPLSICQRNRTIASG